MNMTGELEHTGEDGIDENHRVFVMGGKEFRQTHGIDACRFQTYANLITRVQLLGLFNFVEELFISRFFVRDGEVIPDYLTCVVHDGNIMFL